MYLLEWGFTLVVQQQKRDQSPTRINTIDEWCIQCFRHGLFVYVNYWERIKFGGILWGDEWLFQKQRCIDERIRIYSEAKDRVQNIRLHVAIYSCWWHVGAFVGTNILIVKWYFSFRLWNLVTTEWYIIYIISKDIYQSLSLQLIFFTSIILLISLTLLSLYDHHSYHHPTTLLIDIYRPLIVLTNQNQNENKKFLYWHHYTHNKHMTYVNIDVQKVYLNFRTNITAILSYWHMV